MKIAIISNLYEPFARGGAEVIVKRTALEFLSMGHEVTVITSQPWSENKTFQPIFSEESGIRIVRYAVPNIYFYPKDTTKPFLLRGLWHLFDGLNVFSARSCKQILKTVNPDLVITHNLMGMSYFIPNIIRSLGVKHVHILHDIQLAIRSGLMKKGEEQSWMADGLLAHFYQKVTKWLFSSPDIVISPSEFLKEFYSQKGYFLHSNFQIIRNPIPARFLSYSTGGEKAPSNRFRFGYIGQLERHKGIDVLQQAIYQNPQMNAVVEFAGDGSLKAQIEALANEDERVVYQGKIPNEKLPEWYQTLDCVIVPTLTYENSPTVIYESLACGIPVIASNIGGAGELINEKTGVTVEPGKVNELVHAMKEMMSRQGKYSSEVIREEVKALTVKNYCEKILSL